MAIIIKPPHSIPKEHINKPRVFLAGSIDMGKAENWQVRVEEALADLDIVILNPRRDGWDWSTEQSIDNPIFAEQVNWEQDMMEMSNFHTFYFDPNGKSPITLMEFGMHMDWDSVVCCQPGFWRKGNVDIICQRNDIDCYDNVDGFIKAVRDRAIGFLELYGSNNGN